MLFDATMKLFYILLSVYFVHILSFSNLVSILFALTISHNTLAFVYSKSQREYLAQNWRRHSIPIALLIVSIITMMLYDAPSIHLLFAIHHVFNEVFLVQRRLPSIPKGLQLSRILLATSVFFAITRDSAEYLPQLPSYVWPVLVLGSGIIFAGSLFYFRRSLPKNWVSKELLFEGSGFAVAVWCAFYQSGTLDHVLFYHFLLWSVYPIAKLAGVGWRPTAKYAFWTLFLFGAAIPFTPLSVNWGGLNLDQLSYITRLTAYFHFMSSMALSQAHPLWVRRWFIKTQSDSVVTPVSKAA